MILSADGGQILTAAPTWLQYQANLSIIDNPRLVQDATQNRPFVWSAVQRPGAGGYGGDGYSAASFQRVGTPVAE
jgi:hypothetical protein